MWIKIVMFTILVGILAMGSLLGCGADDDNNNKDDAGGDDAAEDDDTGVIDDDDTSPNGEDDDDTGIPDDDNDDNDTGDDDDDTTGTNDFTATLTVNPACDISGVVTWTTEEAATSWVKFGEKSKGFTMRIGSDTLTKNHEVVVVGMHADNDYVLRAFSETAAKEALQSQKMSFTTGSLPYEWMTGELDVYKPESVNDGWTITNLCTMTMQNHLVVVMYDMSGEVVWYFTPNDKVARIDTEVSWVDDQYVLVGPSVGQGDHPFETDLLGNINWEGPLQTGTGMSDDGSMHHVFHRVANNDYVTTYNDVRDNIIGDEIVQFDRDLNTVWSWNFWDHYKPPSRLGPGGTWTHVNTVELDLDNRYAYINAYAQSMFYKIDMDTGETIWRFGQGGDFDADPNVDYPWYGGGHGVENVGGDHWLIYDNGNQSRRFSRAIIYELNESTMASTVVWEYKGDDAEDQWFSMSIGDADQLDNGNILITAGNAAQNQSRSRFIEVTPEGDKVWQLWMYNLHDSNISTYQTNRIPCLAQSLE